MLCGSKICNKKIKTYVEELSEKVRQEEAKIEEAKNVKEKAKELDEAKQIESDMLYIKSGIEIADRSISEGNYKKKEARLRKSTLDKDLLANAQQKILMGIKRKHKLQASLLITEKKNQKLDI